ncbi:phage N-6-adenine-methyltransferase [Pseudoalteromonas sp. DL2-H2.2]|uniref:phage N-6-adenine-methyltransferase n=1 Tax=Pseudoalteromonas sp. DL2-H2.2 TaxID=2908889 RepID=UPI001F27A22B|nr:phage N-6-adenine-methyltransferase [Pseudoalteromonas sp. DL2-H2.2]MCF2909968.1 phage N-6-adenine-methyltransferase [Pseudoalteromonas sp. DL2-H2.2]
MHNHASQTNKAYRDLTRTPKWLFNAVNREFHFSMDAAALWESRLVDFYLSPFMDSLKMNWSELTSGSVWLNPPYSNIRPWMKKCIEQRALGITTVCLVPRESRAEWWYYALQANEIRDIVGYYCPETGKWRSGGIRFIDAQTGEEMPNELGKPMCLIIFRACNYAPVIQIPVSKLELLNAA